MDWGNLDGWGNEWHRGIKRLVRDINLIYRDTPALWSQDFSQDGFQWVKADDSTNNVLGYVRYGTDGSALLAVCNLSGSSIPNYDLWVPQDGEWQMVLNTDDAVYEGAGNPLPQHIHVAENSATLHLPANSVQWYVLEK